MNRSKKKTTFIIALMAIFAVATFVAVILTFLLPAPKADHALIKTVNNLTAEVPTASVPIMDTYDKTNLSNMGNKKDMSINGGQIETTSNDSWIMVDLKDTPVDKVVIDLSDTDGTNFNMQVYYGDNVAGLKEANSIIEKGKKGSTTFSFPHTVTGVIRIDITNKKMKLTVNSIKLLYSGNNKNTTHSEDVPHTDSYDKTNLLDLGTAKDMTMNGGQIEATSNDPWIMVDLKGTPIDKVVIDLADTDGTSFSMQVYYGDNISSLKESNSIMEKGKKGSTTFNFPHTITGVIRIDITNKKMKLTVNSIKLIYSAKGALVNSPESNTYDVSNLSEIGTSKDMTISGGQIHTTSNDPWIVIDLKGKSVNAIAIDVESESTDKYNMQVFYGDTIANISEAHSIRQKGATGLHIFNFKQIVTGVIRIDITDISMDMEINYIKLIDNSNSKN